MPVGEYPKEQIRQIAADGGLPVADKPDSQEICFIPDDNYRKFVGERVKPKPGELVDAKGNVIGQHPGIQFFTIGQRRKLGLNGNTDTPLYVTSINSENNQIVLGSHEDLMNTSLWASKVNFTSGVRPDGPIEVTAKIRYKATDSPATVTPRGDWVEIKFHEPQRAITPGQAVVFYQGEEVIGGGIIEIEAPKPQESLAKV